MKANLSQRETTQLAAWQGMDLYALVRQARAGAPRFVLHDGPPYANGDIHLGHAMGKILKDMILKYKTMDGYDCPYVPGWDCHGLPIEHQVEKKVSKHDPAVFRRACREHAERYVARQSADFQRLGVLADWDSPYITAAPAVEGATIQAVARLASQGYLQPGFKPVHWCAACRSSLAEAEVEYQPMMSPAVYVAFELAEGSEHAPPGLTPAVLVWTTTPWTLLANEAVCVHPDVRYVWLRVGQRAYWVAADRVPALQAIWGVDEREVLGSSYTGSSCLSWRVHHPLLSKTVPMLPGEHVNTEMGTGCVHTAPAHGVDDHAVGVRHQLPLEHHLGPDGRFAQDTPWVGGLLWSQANDVLVERLRERGALVAHVPVEHSYPHCWRHKKPLVFRATPQWFVPMEPVRAAALQAVEQVQWIPAWGQQRMAGMVSSRPDWCVSRQRLWGVPLPIVLHRTTRKVHPRWIDIMESVGRAVAKEGLEAWAQWDLQDHLGEEAAHYEKATDCLDVWFDSGITHHTVLAARPHLGQPADLYVEGSDQHRGWFQTSLLTAVAMRGEAPYRAVITHGFVVDADGKKMSKSLGNVIAPQDVIRTHGADVLRLWVAATDYTAEMHVSHEILSRLSDSYRRIRNTARYLLSCLFDFDPQQDCVQGETLLALDGYMIRRVQALQDTLRQHVDAYAFHQVYQQVQHFCTIELGALYLDIIKDRLYTSPPKGRLRRSAQTVLWVTLEALVRWLAPILSFTAEELWGHMPCRQEPSVLLSTWYTDWPVGVAEQDVAWDQVWAIRQAVNHAIEQARQDGLLGGALEASVRIQATEAWRPVLQALDGEWHHLCLVSACTWQVVTHAPSADSTLSGVWLHVEPVAASKCARCWHRCPDVDTCADYPGVCRRCVDHLEGREQLRRVA